MTDESISDKLRPIVAANLLSKKIDKVEDIELRIELRELLSIIIQGL